MRRLVLALPLVLGCVALIANSDLKGAGQKGGQARPVTKQVDIDINCADDVKVRTLQTPTGEFDGKGNVKQLSNAEKRKLKGDTPEEQRLPGYKIELSGLHAGDVVKVSIGKPKSSTSKSDDKAKVTYTHMGDIVATVSKVSGSTLTVKVSSTAMSQGRYNTQNNNKGNTQTLDDKLVATMIIVEQAAPENKKGK